jgi:hypothetical protein
MLPGHSLPVENRPSNGAHPSYLQHPEGSDNKLNAGYQQRSHQTTQTATFGLTSQQVNSRNFKQPKLNAYTPPTTSQSRETVHANFTFGGHRDGNMRTSSHHLIGICPPSLSTCQSAQSEEETVFDPMTLDDPPDVFCKDETLPHKHKQTAGVCPPIVLLFSSIFLLIILFRIIPSLFGSMNVILIYQR